jgi:hypothetical protein
MSQPQLGALQPRRLGLRAPNPTSDGDAPPLANEFGQIAGIGNRPGAGL